MAALIWCCGRTLAHPATRSSSFAGQPIVRVDFFGLSFNHANEIISSAVDVKSPITIKFVSVDDRAERGPADTCSVIGVDLKIGHVFAALPKVPRQSSGGLLFPLRYLRQDLDQAKDAVRQVAAAS